LGRKQSRFVEVIEKLDGLMRNAKPTVPEKELLRLAKVVQRGDAVFRGYQY